MFSSLKRTLRLNPKYKENFLSVCGNKSEYIQGLFQKGYAYNFSEIGQKKGKIFENFGKNVQILKIF